MTWHASLIALLGLTFLSALGAIRPGRPISRTGPLRGFLLADNTLRKYSVVNLLWSTDFSLNGMLYQIWLGYQIGAWALVPQAAWAASYLILGRYSSDVASNDSLHGALGNSYTPAIRRVAGVFSVVGAIGLVGWEFSVGRSTFAGLIPATNGTSGSQLALFFSFAVVIGCVLYTTMGGLRGNAIADIFQTGLKLLGFCVLSVLLWKHFSTSTVSLSAVAFPSYSVMLDRMGRWGLVTNLAFSLAWQFVDMSTWQTVISGAKNKSAKENTSTLNLGGLSVFIAPGIIGTLLGILLTSHVDVTAANVMTQSVSILPPGWLPILTMIALIAAMMSTIDGLLLASGYALVVDVFKPGARLDELDNNTELATSILVALRLSFVGIAILGSVGITKLMKVLHLDEFNIMYVIIIPHLALFGPVICSLKKRRPKRMPTWVILPAAAGVGIGAVWIGSAFEYSVMLDGAGFFTLVFSFLAAWGFTSKAQKATVPQVSTI